jgi:hypothetical protein
MIVCVFLGVVSSVECGTPGILVLSSETDSDWVPSDTAQATVGIDSPRFLGLKGSFLPNETAQYRFSIVFQSCYSSQIAAIPVNFSFDGKDHSSTQIDLALSAGFRYPFSVVADTLVQCTIMKLTYGQDVVDWGALDDVTESVAETCFEGGCADADLTREDGCGAPTAVFTEPLTRTWGKKFAIDVSIFLFYIGKIADDD